MHRLGFEVEGLPPKKDGASSMWRKEPDVTRVLALRLAAAAALGDGPRLVRDIELDLVVHLARNDRSVGDLDNFVTGVLDALQTAHPNTPWRREPRWLAAEHAHVRPDRWAAITDDVEVVTISARKVVGAAADRYEICLVGAGGSP